MDAVKAKVSAIEIQSIGNAVDNITDAWGQLFTQTIRSYTELNQVLS